MTWTKLGTEFFDQLVDADFPADLDDACQLTHTQAVHYVYSVESMDLRFKKSVLRRFATSTKADQAADALVKAGIWSDHGREYEVAHHADIVRQSLTAQQVKREKDKRDKRRKRGGVGGAVGTDTGSDSGIDVGATQTDRHNRQSTSGSAVVTDEASEQIDPWTGEVLHPDGRLVPERSDAAERSEDVCPECHEPTSRRSKSARCGHRHKGHYRDEDAA